MTSDLAIGLSLKPDEAEKIKIRFGIKPRDGDTAEVRDIRGNEKPYGRPKSIRSWCRGFTSCARLIATELVAHPRHPWRRLLLTGGGADVKGITEYFGARLQIPVARARPVLQADAQALKKSKKP